MTSSCLTLANVSAEDFRKGFVEETRGQDINTLPCLSIQERKILLDDFLESLSQTVYLAIQRHYLRGNGSNYDYCLWETKASACYGALLQSLRGVFIEDHFNHFINDQSSSNSKTSITCFAQSIIDIFFSYMIPQLNNSIKDSMIILIQTMAVDLLIGIFTEIHSQPAVILEIMPSPHTFNKYVRGLMPSRLLGIVAVYGAIIEQLYFGISINCQETVRRIVISINKGLQRQYQELVTIFKATGKGMGPAQISQRNQVIDSKNTVLPVPLQAEGLNFTELNQLAATILFHISRNCGKIYDSQPFMFFDITGQPTAGQQATIIASYEKLKRPNLQLQKDLLIPAVTAHTQKLAEGIINQNMANWNGPPPNNWNQQWGGGPPPNNWNPSQQWGNPGWNQNQQWGGGPPNNWNPNQQWHNNWNPNQQWHNNWNPNQQWGGPPPNNWNQNQQWGNPGWNQNQQWGNPGWNQNQQWGGPPPNN